MQNAIFTFQLRTDTTHEISGLSSRMIDQSGSQQEFRRKRWQTRRAVLAGGLLALLYPLLRFIGYEVPRRPKLVEINSQRPTNGVLSHNDFILIDGEGGCWAVSRKCTHLGCKINYHEKDGVLECPCHQSRFSLEGTVLHGPAKHHLTVYPVEKRDTAPYYVVTT